MRCLDGAHTTAYSSLPLKRSPLVVLLALVALALGMWSDAARGDEPAGPAGHRTLIQNAALVVTMDPTLGDGPLGTLADADVLFAGDTIIAVQSGLAAPADILHRILGSEAEPRLDAMRLAVPK